MDFTEDGRIAGRMDGGCGSCSGRRRSGNGDITVDELGRRSATQLSTLIETLLSNSFRRVTNNNSIEFKAMAELFISTLSQQTRKL